MILGDFDRMNIIKHNSYDDEKQQIEDDEKQMTLPTNGYIGNDNQYNLKSIEEKIKPEIYDENNENIKVENGKSKNKYIKYDKKRRKSKKSKKTRKRHRSHSKGNGNSEIAAAADYHNNNFAYIGKQLRENHRGSVVAKPDYDIEDLTPNPYFSKQRSNTLIQDNINNDLDDTTTNTLKQGE